MNDITAEECKITRKVEFSMVRKNTQQPVFMIDGKQYNDGTLDKVMLQGDSEEWLLINSSVNSVMHPFHIHINPFQVVEVFDPSTMKEPRNMGSDYIWHDTIAIPAGFFQPIVPNPVPTNPADYKFVPGHIKIRHRFLDFAGKFVLHCHILGHEDRGMMQLIEVVSNKTTVKHH
jgi:FtsP/CotA-like multicopper oxidase with cupredoxin domain